jgi:hypothetical protein
MNPYGNGNGNAHENGNGVYPSNGYPQSYDTVTSATGSGSQGTELWNNSTDPSSENSSIDRMQQAAKPEPETYGFSGFGGTPIQGLQGPIFEEHGHNAPIYGEPGYGQSYSNSGPMYGYQGSDIPPTPPPHLPSKSNAPRPAVGLGASSRSYDSGPHDQEKERRLDPGEKRKSWLRRRFSKNN